MSSAKEAFISGAITKSLPAERITRIGSADTSTTTTRVHVGMYRPASERTGALSELEYFEHTGYKLGEDYRQTRAEVFERLGVSHSSVRLTKQEEESMIEAYSKLRYSSAFGPSSIRESSPKLARTVELTAEKGLLRKTFEEQKLSITESTLGEYITKKSVMSDIDYKAYSFPQFAYEKTIGSKSDIEKFGLGLFSQQILGFYDIGKQLAGVRHEYLDLLSVAQSYKPAIDVPVVRGFAPFKRDGDLAYNVGVGVGLAIDIATLRAFAKSAVGFVRQPKTLTAYLSELRTSGSSLQSPPAVFRDVEIYARRLTTKEFVKGMVDPRNIPHEIRQFVKDVKATIKGENIEREVSRLTTASRAHVKIQYEPVPSDVAKDIAKVETKARTMISREPLRRIETEKGLTERTNIVFHHKLEARPDPVQKLEQVRDYIRDVRHKAYHDLYLPLKSLRESPVSAQDIAKIKEKIPLARTAPSASDVGAIRKTADDIVRQIKQDLKNDFGDLGLGEPPKSTYFEPKTPTPSEQKMPTLGRQQFVHGERISSIQETIAKSMDDIDTVRARITSDIHARIHKARRKLDRYGLEGEFDIVRYPSSVRPPHPPAPSIRVSTLTDMRTELWNLSNIGINVRNLSVPQRGRDEAGRRMTEREKPRREVQPKEEPVIPVLRRPSEDETTTFRSGTAYKPILVPKLQVIEDIKKLQVPRMTLKTAEISMQKLEIPRPFFARGRAPPFHLDRSAERRRGRKGWMITEIYTYRLPDMTRALRELNKLRRRS